MYMLRQPVNGTPHARNICQIDSMTQMEWPQIAEREPSANTKWPGHLQLTCRCYHQQNPKREPKPTYRISIIRTCINAHPMNLKNNENINGNHLRANVCLVITLVYIFFFPVVVVNFYNHLNDAWLWPSGCIRSHCPFGPSIGIALAFPFHPVWEKARRQIVFFLSFCSRCHNV